MIKMHALRLVPGLSLARLRPLALAALLIAGGLSALAQAPAPPGTKVMDTSALHPPAGARVAIVEFADLQCPACAHANPVLRGAAAKYGIPLVRHDYLIPSHNWSLKAAVNARWFDAQSKALGEEYRDQIFASQMQIYNPYMLRDFTEKFAQSHHVTLPFEVDPQGKLIALVQADNELGKRTGVQATPSIFIVAANSKGAPYIEVRNPDRDLYQAIDQALADTKAAAPAARHGAGR